MLNGRDGLPKSFLPLGSIRRIRESGSF